MNTLGDYWKKNGKLFLSLFAVAAFLPVMLLGALSPDGFKLLTQADEETPLRIWFEPGSVVARTGDTFKLKVMAEYDDKNKLIPRISLATKASLGIKVTAVEIQNTNPFVGKVEVGEIEVTAQEEGLKTISVVEGSVNTTLPSLPLVTTQAKITVRR